MNLVYAIAAGGAVGAVMRHLVARQIMKLAGVGFPLGTLVVNVVGSFLMGVLVALLVHGWKVGAELRAFLMVGVLGGFTTFSTFSLEFVRLIGREEFGAATAYALASVVLAVTSVLVGIYIVHKW